jgi:PAS domain S-box-containing protein
MMAPSQLRDGASHPCAAPQAIAGEPAAHPSHQTDASPVEHVEDHRREQTLLQTVVDSVDDLIFAKDLQGHFILLNRALREGCGLEVGCRTQDLFEPDLVLGYEGTDHQLVSTGKPVAADEIIPIRGQPRLFQTVKVPWVVDGALYGVIGVSRDITARQQRRTPFAKARRCTVASWRRAPTVSR